MPRKEQASPTASAGEKGGAEKAFAEKDDDAMSQQDMPAPRPGGPRLVLDNRGLVAHNLGKSFKKRPVLRDVNVSVQRGEVVGLLGPNGAGKTTCFYIITGLIRPISARCIIDNQEITGAADVSPRAARHRLSAARGVDFPRPHRRGQSPRRARSGGVVRAPSARPSIDELLAEFSITHLRRAPSMALSGGERRRVEIARALATDPKFILLDEPLAGIDPIALNDIRDLVAHLKDRGIGVVITDHNVRETLGIVDRAYILHEGRVLKEGKPSDIVADADVRRFYSAKNSAFSFLPRSTARGRVTTDASPDINSSHGPAIIGRQ